jgi:Mrp family chromosome partitioning ATPase
VIEGGQREDLTSLLGLDATRSVSAYAAGKATAADCIQATASGVFVIPASNAPVPAAQITERLRQLMRDVAIDFDCVLIDVPPILEKTDAMVIGAVVPRLLLVVEAGRTRHEVVLRAKKELQGEKVEIIGTVLNKHRHFIPLWIYRWLIG